MAVFFIIFSIIYSLTNIIKNFISSYGSIAVFITMIFESASFPIPSEVVLPLTGLLAKDHMLNIYVAFSAAFLGSIIGMAIDYYIGYIIGKEIVYSHLKIFHIERKKLDEFDIWFNRNGPITVLFSRFIPIVRGLISFPAGFAKMKLRTFLAYSAIGIFIYNTLLIGYGYYLLSSSSFYIIIASIGFFGLCLYFVYKFFISYVRSKASNNKA
ncbi:MAG: DedA family protein [Candidatus Micrarchaeia archaeon]